MVTTCTIDDIQPQGVKTLSASPIDLDYTSVDPKSIATLDDCIRLIKEFEIKPPRGVWDQGKPAGDLMNRGS